jgi:serine/threonine-protein kinase
VVLYELLTGRRPFGGTNLAEITAAVCEHEPPRADMVDASVPRALADVAARAMAKLPAERYRSARALSRDLRLWLDAQDVVDDRAEALATAPSVGARRPLALALGIAGALALTVGMSAIWLRQPVVPAPPAATVVSSPVADAAAAPLVTAQAAAAATPASAPGAAGAQAAAASPRVAISDSNTASHATAPARSQTKPVVKTAPVARTGEPARSAAVAPARTGSGNARVKSAAAIVATPASPAPAAPSGTVIVAVSPWGQVEVDGAPAGVAPPLSQLQLAEGEHTIVLRNADFAAHRVTVNVQAGQSVTVRHRFGP